MFRGDTMKKKKMTQSWTISDELWEEIKEYIPNLIQLLFLVCGQACPSGRCWKVSSMFCELDANGKQCRENMVPAAVSTGIFKNDRRQASLKRYGYWVWRNTMNWKELAGNGRALMVVW